MMQFWISRDSCTGCGACVNTCEQNAIEMKCDDILGFLYPSVNQDRCVGCNKCKKSCSVYCEEHRYQLLSYGSVDRISILGYAAWSKDDALRIESTSGGLFTELAKGVLDEQGVVYGARYSEDMTVGHVGICEERELQDLRRSKYVQSETRYVFREVKRYLNDNKEVLFVGTPCQIAGLYGYLQRDYENLYTVEFICLGVNSPVVYKKWIEELETINGKRIKDIWFKYKKGGWRESPMCTRIEFLDGSELILDKNTNFFMKGYLQGGYYVRPSCSQCKRMGKNRYSDIVFGDYWDVKRGADDGKGTSVLLIQSIKGQKLFDRIKENISYYPIDVNKISEGNPRFLSPAPYNKKSVDFFDALQSDCFSAVVKRYTMDDTLVPDILVKISNGNGET